MEFKEIPLLVVVSSGDNSKWYEQPRDTINPRFLDSVQRHEYGEISWKYGDKEILIIDPLKQQGG